MHDRLDRMGPQDLADGLPVAHLADDERGIEHRLAKAAGQIVQHDDALAAVAQLEGDMTADVACAAGN